MDKLDSKKLDDSSLQEISGGNIYAAERIILDVIGIVPNTDIYDENTFCYYNEKGLDYALFKKIGNRVLELYSQSLSDNEIKDIVIKEFELDSPS